MKVSYFDGTDKKALADHSNLLGWYSESDWETFLRTGVVIGHRLQSGEIVSSAYFSNFENSAGSLGAVIVKSRFQGKKLGKDLIEKVQTMLPSPDFVLSLVSTERGKKMYEHAGFVEVGNTHKFVSDGDVLVDDSKTEVEVRQIKNDDLAFVLQLDKLAVSFDRTKLITQRLKQSTSAIVALRNGEIVGFAMTCADGEREVIGPLEASDFETARALLTALFGLNKKFRMDVPHWQTELINWLPKVGFHLERICPWMTYKGVPLRSTSDHYFALVSQALG